MKDGLQVDHMFGGHGRRRSLQSKFTCWALCWACHYQKTNNVPSAAHWLKAFVAHCERHDTGAIGHDGYLHAASIARVRLGSLEAMGRAGT